MPIFSPIRFPTIRPVRMTDGKERRSVAFPFVFVAAFTSAFT